MDVTENTSHEVLERSPRGARLRRRALATTGMILLVLGFFAAIGFGHYIVLMLLAAILGGSAYGIFVLVRRRNVPGKAAPALLGVGRKVASGAGRAREGAGRAKGSAGRLKERARAKATRPPKERKPRNPSREIARLNSHGMELRRNGDPAGAVQAHQAALELVRTTDDRNTEAMTLNNLALALGHAGDEHAAVVRFDEAATLLRELEDEHHEGQVLANLGLLHGRSGRKEQAVYCLETALEKLDPGSRAHSRVAEQLRRAS
jgi:tetratricopeptide (TPR) repeat protein